VTKKECVDSKGNTWEWGTVRSTESMNKVLHETERKHAEEGGDYGVGK